MKSSEPNNCMSEAAIATHGLIDIAVLDDDPDFRNYIEDLLRDEGVYVVRTFGHPEELFTSSREPRPGHCAARHEDGAEPAESRCSNSF